MDVAANPWLIAGARPRLAEFTMNVAWTPLSLACWRESSAEALSTTTVSGLAGRDCRQLLSRPPEFQLTMTTADFT